MDVERDVVAVGEFALEDDAGEAVGAVQSDVALDRALDPRTGPVYRGSVRLKGSTGMKLIVTMSRDEDGAFVVECPSIPGCISQGDTEEDALRNIRDAVEQCLAVRADRGMPLTVETREIEVAVR